MTLKSLSECNAAIVGNVTGWLDMGLTKNSNYTAGQNARTSFVKIFNGMQSISLDRSFEVSCQHAIGVFFQGC